VRVISDVRNASVLEFHIVNKVSRLVGNSKNLKTSSVAEIAGHALSLCNVTCYINTHFKRVYVT
jgi:hypothetical protein